jgi:hypothetical protein
MIHKKATFNLENAKYLSNFIEVFMNFDAINLEKLDEKSLDFLWENVVSVTIRLSLN